MAGEVLDAAAAAKQVRGGGGAGGAGEAPETAGAEGVAKTGDPVLASWRALLGLDDGGDSDGGADAARERASVLADRAHDEAALEKERGLSEEGGRGGMVPDPLRCCARLAEAIHENGRKLGKAATKRRDTQIMELLRSDLGPFPREVVALDVSRHMRELGSNIGMTVVRQLRYVVRGRDPMDRGVEAMVMRRLKCMDAGLVATALPAFSLERTQVENLTLPMANRLYEEVPPTKAANLIAAARLFDHFDHKEVTARLLHQPAGRSNPPQESVDAAVRWVLALPKGASTNAIMAELIHSVCRYDSKRAAKLVKQFKLSVDDFPDVVRARDLATVRWQIAQIDTLGPATLADYVKDRGEHLATDVMHMLLRKRDAADPVVRMIASQFAGAVDFDSLDREIVLYSDAELEVAWEEADAAAALAAAPSDPGSYLQLPYDAKVSFVDTKDQVIDACKVLERARFVAIDCEWRPWTSTFDMTRVALMQIGCKEQIFLFDLPTLSASKVLVPVNEALKRVFTTPTVSLVGFAVRMDLRSVRRSYAELDFPEVIKSVVDFAENTSRIFPGCNTATKGASLSDLSEAVLRKKLDKGTRMSNWEHRPLSRSQTVYAALDVHVLLELVDAASSQPESALHDLAAAT